jgi:hypothetical protein
MTTNDQARLEQAQLLLNKTVEALKNCGFYSEVYLAGAVNLESEGEEGPGCPLVSTSTLDKLRLHYFLAECQAMVLQAELRKTEPEQALSA